MSPGCLADASQMPLVLFYIRKAVLWLAAFGIIALAIKQIDSPNLDDFILFCNR